MAEKKQIGEVTDYFQHVKAAAIKLFSGLKVGDRINIQGGEKDFEIKVSSMQINRKPVKEAKKGDEVGILVPEDVHKGYRVYKA